MTDQNLPDELVFTSELGSFPFEIPAPRSGKHYELWRAEVCEGRHGCLDSYVE